MFKAGSSYYRTILDFLHDWADICDVCDTEADTQPQSNVIQVTDYEVYDAVEDSRCLKAPK